MILSELLSLLREQTRPDGQHAARRPASLRGAKRAPPRRLPGGSVCSLGAVARHSRTSSGAGRAEHHRPPQQGSYLKLAGEESRPLRPDGGLAFRFSLSAMTSRYSSAISSSEHEHEHKHEHEQPPRKHLSGPAMLIQRCLQ